MLLGETTTTDDRSYLNDVFMVKTAILVFFEGKYKDGFQGGRRKAYFTVSPSQQATLF